MMVTSADCEAERPPTPKRRKLRKGTRSCWECKRRKIRCTFVSPTEPTCDGCRSRRAKCVSQDFPDQAEAATSSKVDRLTRMEALVEHLAGQAGSTTLNGFPHPRQTAGIGITQEAVVDSRLLTPTSLKSSNSGTNPVSNLRLQSKSLHNELCNALLVAWPSLRELNLLTNVPVGISPLFHGTVCKPYSSFLSQHVKSPRDILQPPPPGSHPALIARKLLLLGSFLQGFPSQTVKDLNIQGTRCYEVMAHAVETASRLVTSNDSLVDSLEGIECIMIESMFQNNAGSLRRAWVTNRRAMAIAQTMGLHRSSTKSVNVLDVQTRERIEPEYMWARLVFSDRYLSLMLGLPQGSPENPFATPEAMKGCAPLDRMERLEAVVGGLILQRTKEGLLDLEATQDIDRLLQDAAASMPAQWWLPPDVASLAGCDASSFSDTIRIMYQLTHYHLLAQLHLPYILLPSTDQRYDYSKITAVNASREILSRFVSFRGSSTVAAYCRGVDFLAFVASTTLCLAHVDARRQHETDASHRTTVFHFLAHQRLGDRGLMERMLQIMEKMVQDTSDAIASRIARVLRRLLDVEAAVADGGSCSATVDLEPGEQGLLSGSVEDCGDDGAQIKIPCLGTIKIEHLPEQHRRMEVTSSAPGHQTSDRFVETDCQATLLNSDIARPSEESRATASDQVLLSLEGSPRDLGPMLEPAGVADVDDWALQGVDTALFDSFVRGLM